MKEKQNKYLSLGNSTIVKLKESSNKLGLSETMTVRIAIALLHARILNNFEGIETLKLLKND